MKIRGVRDVFTSRHLHGSAGDYLGCGTMQVVDPGPWSDAMEFHAGTMSPPAKSVLISYSGTI